MNKLRLSALALIFLASSCGEKPAKPPLSQAPLAGAAIGGSFTLTDQDGKQRTWDEFKGKYRIIYFGYTQCPDICTPDTQHLMAGLKRFEKASPALAAKIQPMFITVDPKRDTPEVLKQFVSAFHPNLIGLTGSEEQIKETANKFAVFFSKVEGSAPDAYLMQHSQTPYLMDPDGKPLAILPADQTNTPDTNEGAPELVEADLAKWVR